MCLISEEIQANPLNRMKNKQTSDEANVKNYRYWIGYKFLHGDKK